MRNALFGLLLFALGWTLGASADDLTLGEVNGAPVTAAQLYEVAARISGPTGEPLSEEDRKEALDRLIDEELLYQEALRQGLDKDPKVKKVMINTLLRQEVYSSIRNSDFSEEELEAYYNAHKDEFVVPEKVQIKRILIKTGGERSDREARKLAQDLRDQLADDPYKFKDLATQYSEDPYRRRGGDVGFVPREGKPGLDQEIVDKAFTMQVDQVSEVFKTAEGYNIIAVSNKRDRVERTYQQMKGSVLRKVKNDKLTELFEEYTARLRQTASIRLDDAAVRALDLRYSRSSEPIGPVLEGDEEEEEP